MVETREVNMHLTTEDIKVVKQLMVELRLYRIEDDESREMAVDGMYEDERELAEKLGITLEL